MKRYISLLFFVIIVCNMAFSSDHIILRNGRESDVKLIQVNDEKIIFTLIGDRTKIQRETPSKDIYMVYLEKQGNIYFSADGKRKTGEPKRIDPKKNDVIYLVSGAEIGAEDIVISEDFIKYKVKKQGFLKSSVNEVSLNKSEVFMVRYKSGMVDVITSLDAPEVKEEPTPAEEIKKPESEPKSVVIFHAVAKGENLHKIAEKYNVTPQQIIEWNDLPAKTSISKQLTVGMQLMIILPK